MGAFRAAGGQFDLDARSVVRDRFALRLVGRCVIGQAQLGRDRGDGEDQIDGGDGADTLSGGDEDDDITGGNGNGNDSVTGDDGNDTMEGGLGNDTYLVDRTGEVVQGEVAFGSGGGIDVVITSANFTAPANIELVRALAGAGGATRWLAGQGRIRLSSVRSRTAGRAWPPAT